MWLCRATARKNRIDFQNFAKFCEKALNFQHFEQNFWNFRVGSIFSVRSFRAEAPKAKGEKKKTTLSVALPSHRSKKPHWFSKFWKILRKREISFTLNRIFEFPVLVPFFQCGVSEQKRPKPKARRKTSHWMWLCRATARKNRIEFQIFIENCEIAYYFLSYQVFLDFPRCCHFFGSAAPHFWKRMHGNTNPHQHQKQTNSNRQRVMPELTKSWIILVGDDGLQFTPAVPWVPEVYVSGLAVNCCCVAWQRVCQWMWRRWRLKRVGGNMRGSIPVWCAHLVQLQGRK